MNHQDIASRWAHQSAAELKSGNMFFRGCSIYSYGSHYEIARIIENKGVRIALFNPLRYSVSTARHVSYCHSAWVRRVGPGRLHYIDHSMWDDIVSGRMTLAAAIKKQSRLEAAAAKEALRYAKRQRQEKAAWHRSDITERLLDLGIPKGKHPKFTTRREMIVNLVGPWPKDTTLKALAAAPKQVLNDPMQLRAWLDLAS